MLALFKLFHLLSVLIWVGGMFFAYVMLRPAIVEILEPSQRLRLWNSVFRRFFSWVWVSIGVLLASGTYMIYLQGGMAHTGKHVHIMLASGSVMMAIYGHVYFGLYRKLSRLVGIQNWKDAGETLVKIRKLIAVNLALGIFTICVALTGAIQVYS